MTQRLLACLLFGGMLCAGLKVAAPATAMPLAEVVSTIRDAHGYYVHAAASLQGADCSGLVSVAQSLATGAPIHRYGSTRTLLAGGWQDAIPGATPGDLFIIGVNYGHMVAQVDGVGIEATTSGAPFKVGPNARSVWSPEFRQYHLDPRVLVV